MPDILGEKSYQSYEYVSRYTPFPYYYHTLDKKFIYGTTAQLDKTIAYSLHKVQDNDTLDSLALEYYNNPTFFWVIADFNEIQNPYIKLEKDSNIKIPVLSSIKFIT